LLNQIKVLALKLAQKILGAEISAFLLVRGRLKAAPATARDRQNKKITQIILFLHKKSKKMNMSEFFSQFSRHEANTYSTYLALQPIFGLGLMTKISPFLSILRSVRPAWGP
jgi:hypothetical protein